jgi:hypothetical protein
MEKLSQMALCPQCIQTSVQEPCSQLPFGLECDLQLWGQGPAISNWIE